MSTMPPRQKIYHITHVDNLAGIIGAGELVCDAIRIRTGMINTSIGMSSIKERRLINPVRCYPGTFVGDYVPFYFCPRSVMLYVVKMGDNPGLTYRDGQGPILHLEAVLDDAIDAIDASAGHWVFTTGNASTAYAQFFKTRSDFNQVDWQAVVSKHWSNPIVKEGKQAELLAHETFPWELVSRIGVATRSIKSKVEAELKSVVHRPPVSVEPNWYY
jgi:ssDNA thymidine ADP-ribosyltransferase, DarT